MDDIYYHILSHYRLFFYGEMIHFNQNCYLVHKFKTKIILSLIFGVTFIIFAITILLIGIIIICNSTLRLKIWNYIVSNAGTYISGSEKSKTFEMDEENLSIFFD
jgi:hypothetical protein